MHMMLLQNWIQAESEQLSHKGLPSQQLLAKCRHAKSCLILNTWLRAVAAFHLLSSRDNNFRRMAEYDYSNDASGNL